VLCPKSFAASWSTGVIKLLCKHAKTTHCLNHHPKIPPWQHLANGCFKKNLPIAFLTPLGNHMKLFIRIVTRTAPPQRNTHHLETKLKIS
jgi:hypothetical protein